MPDASFHLPSIKESWTVARVLGAVFPVRPSVRPIQRVQNRSTPKGSSAEAAGFDLPRKGEGVFFSDEMDGPSRLSVQLCDNKENDRIRAVAGIYRNHADNPASVSSGIFLETWA